ncbi:ubiquinol oxidase subunit II [Amantichitinum ursilacus]|uniref:Ubiquinol oxidase subunit 2 n=1 Tax=Amantichitinum ursilacus TaxID=857265 RepID=A0A0N0GLS2_9NEIS|nr:ubiquinol oxidase subunit II [Amantichitinum ursilacus]KPC50174.1 Cytochrome bo(3) ubiquinol oxidase subunit 2 precursor [Amantichitinum ursilacus]
MSVISSLQVGVLDPQGPVAAAERTILLNATVIMLAVIIPVILLTLAFAWWFRAGNAKAKRSPDFAYSGPVEVVVWAIPMLIVLFLGGIAWIGSHDLDPPKRILAKHSPIDVQVVSLDWKWLFIYPALGVASVNKLVVPAGAPLRLQLTSATVMNSFFVPQLGSQIYTMAGMSTRLNLLADKPGVYPGLSAQFSGQGFSDMRFNVQALPEGQFNQWVATAKRNPAQLTAATYAQLAKPGLQATPLEFGAIGQGVFDAIVDARPLPVSASATESAASPADDASTSDHSAMAM